MSIEFGGTYQVLGLVVAGCGGWVSDASVIFSTADGEIETEGFAADSPEPRFIPYDVVASGVKIVI